MIEYLPPHFYKANSKVRNILNLAERVAVIKEYISSSNPSFQVLASKYDCSYIQIKNIIENRKSILKAYENSEIHKRNDMDALIDPENDAAMKREAKIVFMNKVMYEYLQRVVYLNYVIDDDRARQKAEQIEKIIEIENFQVNDDWIESFKANYGLREFNIESLQEDVILEGPKKPHIGAEDMIEFVRRKELKARKAKRISMGKRAHKYNVGGPNKKRNREENSDDGSCSSGDVEVGISNDFHPVTYHDLILRGLTVTKPVHPTNAMYSAELQKKNDQSSVFSLSEIESAEEALKYLKILEEYAMLQDNFRAIGLITQLEKLLKEDDKEKEKVKKDEMTFED